MMRVNMLRASGDPNIVVRTGGAVFVDSGDFNAGITGGDWEEGDIGILFVAADGRDDAFTVTGWTEIVASNLSYNREHSIWVRTMQRDDATVTSVSGGALSKTLATVVWFKNAVLPVAGDFASWGESTTGTTGPNPPAAPGSIVATDIVVAFGMNDSPNATITGMPTGYTEITKDSALNYAGNNCTVGVGYKRNCTTNEDPSAFTGTFTERTSAAHTLVLRRST